MIGNCQIEALVSIKITNSDGSGTVSYRIDFTR
jgi:hypothetical protein